MTYRRGIAWSGVALGPARRFAGNHRNGRSVLAAAYMLVSSGRHIWGTIGRSAHRPGCALVARSGAVALPCACFHVSTRIRLVRPGSTLQDGRSSFRALLPRRALRAGRRRAPSRAGPLLLELIDQLQEAPSRQGHEEPDDHRDEEQGDVNLLRMTWAAWSAISSAGASASAINVGAGGHERCVQRFTASSSPGPVIRVLCTYAGESCCSASVSGSSCFVAGSAAAVCRRKPRNRSTRCTPCSTSRTSCWTP